MAIENALNDFRMRALNSSHRLIRTLSGGRILGSRALGMPVVELHVTGRKSGQRRSTLLTSPVNEGGRVVLIASKGGDSRHPEWYLNLDANPDIELTIDGETKPYRARTASADEKAALWPQVVKAYRGYGKYQQRSSRDIPVVICEPR